MKHTHVGFNLLWMYNPDDPRQPYAPDLHLLDFLADQGFSFLRFPLNYWFWIENFSYSQPNERILCLIDDYVRQAVDRGFHVSLNLHRAPGYCINGAELERHNLWRDGEAQQAFSAMWTAFARRYGSYTPEQLSFDLLNEPPEIGQYGMTRDTHQRLMRRVIGEIRAINPDRVVVLDGLGGGNLAMPELADTGAIQSTRGYQPMSITHHRASWCRETQGLPMEEYPGARYQGKLWNRQTLEDHYRSWRKMNDRGVQVHVGEMGCYDTIPNPTALAWFEDVFSLFRQYRWGFALWNFEGPFGVAGHRRPDTRWEQVGSYRIDRDLWELIKQTRDELQK